MMINAIGKAMLCGLIEIQSNPKDSIAFSTIVATTSSPIHPKAKLANVMPNCVADKYESKCSIMLFVMPAKKLPLRILISI